jgi:hypothetical protein
VPPAPPRPSVATQRPAAPPRANALGGAPGATSRPSAPIPPPADDVERLVERALAVVEAHVEIRAGYTAEGGVARAAAWLEEAHRLRPDDPTLWFGWACALHLAAQFASAEATLRACAAAHPSFAPARQVLDGPPSPAWPLTLPPYRPGRATVHPALAEQVLSSVVLATRDGLLPRATLLLRDAGGDLADAATLAAARIEVTAQLPAIGEPRVLGLHGRIHDTPGTPFDFEVVDVPLRPRGHPMRATYERLVAQDDLDLVVLAPSGARIVAERRLAFAPRMRATLDGLRRHLATEAGGEVDRGQLLDAIQRYQRRVDPRSVAF